MAWAGKTPAYKARISRNERIMLLGAVESILQLLVLWKYSEGIVGGQHFLATNLY